MWHRLRAVRSHNYDVTAATSFVESGTQSSCLDPLEAAWTRHGP